MELRPVVHIVNKSRYDFPEPVVYDAEIFMHRDFEEVSDDAFTLFLTEDLSDVEAMGADDTVYFVYIGECKCGEFRRLFDVVAPPSDPEEMVWRVKGWIKGIADEYRYMTYRMLLQTLIDSSPDMIWYKDSAERHVILNDAFCAIVGKSKDFCLGKKHPDIWGISWEEYESSDFACRQSEEEIIKTRKTGIFEEPVLSNGAMYQFTTYKTPLYDRFGNILGTCGIGHDVTNISNMGKELDILLSAIPFPVFLCDREYEIQRLNDAARGLEGIRGGALKNYKTWRDFFLEEEGGARAGQGLIYIAERGGTRAYYSVIEREIRDYFGNVSGFFCMLQNVTYQCMYDDLLFQAANVDPLTGVYNRRFFYETMRGYKNKPVTLLYMDLDNFKRVNDVYGHQKGDKVLKKAAEIIKKQYPEGEVVRFGGDEFVVVIPEYTQQKYLTGGFESIAKSISGLVDKEINLSVSIGHESTESLKTTEELIKRCDERMYEKKHRKRRRDRR